MGTQNQHTLGQRLRQAREDAGLSIRRLALLAGVDNASVIRIEHETRTNPSAETVLKLADALNIDSSEWLPLIGIKAGAVLPTPRTYFRRKFGVNADEADVLARLVDDYRANKEAKR